MLDRRSRIPLWVKLAYSAFMAVLVPVYWYNYGPANFLYYCDVALFLTLVAVWTERPIFVSAPAVGILIPQVLWMVDFLAAAVGVKVIGLTGYMFESKYHWFLRSLSFFHFWLPLFIVWLLFRIGYDRRAFWTWTILAWVLMQVCFFLMASPVTSENEPNAIVNINYVYGFNDQKPQTWMPPLAWLGLLMVGLPLGIYLPTHLILKRFFRPDGVSPVAKQPTPVVGS
jgi:hypothetical protein